MSAGPGAHHHIDVDQTLTRRLAGHGRRGRAGSTADGDGTDPAGVSLRWLRLAVSVLGPVSLATALLYYYGYVPTYAQFWYFGIDVELLDYTTADYVLRSPGSLFAPVLALLILAGLGYWLHVTLPTWGYLVARPQATRIAGLVIVAGGGVLLARGLYGVVDGDVSQTEPIGISPASLGLGALLLLYGWRLRRQPSAPSRQAAGARTTQVVAWTIGWCVVVLSLFWLVNSFAHAYGNGAAAYLERDLVNRPEVILHTRSRLYVEDRGVDPDVLCETSIGSKDYPYRYINLRLLASTDDDLFLVPVTWTRQRGVVLELKKSESRLQYMRWPEQYRCPQVHTRR